MVILLKYYWEEWLYILIIMSFLCQIRLGSQKFLFILFKHVWVKNEAKYSASKLWDNLKWLKDLIFINLQKTQ